LQNPWFSAINMSARARHANADTHEHQLQAAIRVWEGEGGRIDANGAVR
jgi:hypothetical protein